MSFGSGLFASSSWGFGSDTEVCSRVNSELASVAAVLSSLMIEEENTVVFESYIDIDIFTIKFEFNVSSSSYTHHNSLITDYLLNPKKHKIELL